MDEPAAAAGAKACRDITLCVSALTLSDKGVARLMDGFKLYEPALGDPLVLSHIEAALRGAKKAGAAAAASVSEFEVKLREAAAERAEVLAAARRAMGHSGAPSGDAPAAEVAEAEADENAPTAPAPPARKARGKASAAPKKAAAPVARKKKAVLSSDDDDDGGDVDDSDGEPVAPKASRAAPLRARRAAA